MRLRQNKPAAHWSTDFVQHVRTVHFSLVAACLGLLIIVQTKPKDLIAAQEQLLGIQNKLAEWNEHWLDLRMQAHATRKTPITDTEPRFIRVSLDGTERSYALYAYQFDQREQQNWRVNHGREQDDVAGIAYKNWLQTKPTTLAELRERWDELSSGLSFLRVDSYVEANRALDISESPPWSAQAIEIRDAPCREVQACFTTTLRQLSPEQREQSLVSAAVQEPVDFGYVDRFSNHKLIIPVRASRVLIRPQEISFLQAKPESANFGRFAEVFSALDDAATDQQNIPLTQLDGLLRQELASAKSESLQVFGITIPAAIAAFWGTLTILSLQVYFWVHLHELSPKLKPRDPGWDIAWIGLYQSQRARVLFRISSVLCPVLTIAFVGWKTEFRLLLRSRLSESLIGFLLQTDRYFWFFIASSVASLALGLWIVSLAPRNRGIRRRLVPLSQVRQKEGS